MNALIFRETGEPKGALRRDPKESELLTIAG